MLTPLTKIIFQFTILCLICIASSYAQTATKSYGRVDVEIIKEKKPKKIYTKIEIKSAFTGGDSSWIQSLEKTLNQSIPYKNGAKAGKYIVTVVFVVDKEGNMSDIVCV
jgi:antitoxin component YwqK of YwqJK toxin-antitoxin module